MSKSQISLLIVATAIFLSGTSALTYEILWQRQMFLIFGASAPATTAVLTAIFLGIALGSRAAPYLSRWFKNPILTYAALEILIGFWGVLVPDLLKLSDSLYVRSVAALGEQHRFISLIRFALAIIPLLPSTLAMGATIPIMVQTVSKPGRSAVAWAYGVNILGAVAGCLLTGIVWLQAFGLSHSRLIAVGMNMVACGLLFLFRRLTFKTGHSARTETTVETPMPARWLIPAYFVSGFVALGLEIVWLRFLGIVNSNSTLTFTLTLAVYLLGMGIGSLVIYPLIRRFFSAGSSFAIANGGTALAALLTLRVVYDSVYINHKMIILPSMQGTLTISSIYGAEATIIGLLMFLPTIFMGMAFPAICDMATGKGNPPSVWISNAYFAGTLGSVLGILLISVVIIPLLGLHGAFAALVVLSTAVCCLSSYLTGRTNHWLTVSFGLFLSVWSGMVIYHSKPVLKNTLARQENGKWLEYAISDPHQPMSELLRVRAGSTGTVMIKKTPAIEEHFVYVDDQLVASTNIGARVDALILAHLPLLLHPDPQNALTVGFGTGGTSHAMTTHGIKTYCVEIENEVARSAALLKGQNFGVLDNPLFTLILNDARDHLHAGTRSYDVIATDVTNLQYKQNSSLYTVEYFQLMHAKLRTGGIACAWIPMAGIEKQELRILMKSFREVFPHATLWFMNHAHTNFGILIGTPESLHIDFQRLQHGFSDPAIAANLKLIGMTNPLQLIHCLHLDEAGYRTFCGDAPLHTDENPVLEFSSPLSSYKPYETFLENLTETLKFRPDNFRPYIVNATSTQDADWRNHQAASLSFCRVLLETYNFIIHQTRGETRLAIDAVKRASMHAVIGLEAGTQDVTREQYYKSFFSEADHWIKSQVQ